MIEIILVFSGIGCTIYMIGFFLEVRKNRNIRRRNSIMRERVVDFLNKEHAFVNNFKQFNSSLDESYAVIEFKSKKDNTRRLRVVGKIDLDTEKNMIEQNINKETKLQHKLKVFACSFIYCLPKKYREEALGDLLEIYDKEKRLTGKWHALWCILLQSTSLTWTAIRHKFSDYFGVKKEIEK